MTAVYRHFSQAELDAAYDNRAAERNLEARKDDQDRRSQALYARAKVRRDLAYGRAPRQRLDFFHAASGGRPTVAFIHGGYWQRNEKEPNAFVAEGLLAHDLNVALIEYTLAPAVTLTEIVEEIRTAVEWLCTHLQSDFNAGASIIVSGHSAGGHLAAMVANQLGVAAALTISGLFDLEPIRLSNLNTALKMSFKEACANSPSQSRLPFRPVTVAVGEAEMPELVRQSAEYAATLNAANRVSRFLVIPAATHFSILEEVARADGVLAIEMARLAAL